MSWFRRTQQPPRESSYDIIAAAYREFGRRPAGVGTRITPQLWFTPTRQDYSVHGARIATTGLADARTLDRELERRVLPSAPTRGPSDVPTYDEMRFGPWS
jgi:hypothetical protein